jgi:hypothetical protein
MIVDSGIGTKLLSGTAVAVFALAVLTGCSSDKSKRPGYDPSATNAPTTSTTTIASGSVEPTAYIESGDYTNGRHIGLIKTAANGSIDVDVVQFLTGDAAVAAYQQDTGSKEPPDNDYYVRNQNSLIRHLTLADDAVFRVQALGQDNVNATNPDAGKKVSRDEFVGFWSGSHHEQAINTLFWITLKDGTVTAVEEQFVP